MNNHQEKQVLYGGYGLFYDQDFGRSLFGADTRSFVAEQKGYELVVLGFNDCPKSIQNEMPQNFRIYAARPKEGSSVRLRVWELTPKQKELAEKWNFGNDLYDSETSVLNSESLANRTFQMDVVDSSDIGQVVDGLNYNPYLNDKETVLNFAREAHHNFFGEASYSQEGQYSGSKERM